MTNRLAIPSLLAAALLATACDSPSTGSAAGDEVSINFTARTSGAGDPAAARARTSASPSSSTPASPSSAACSSGPHASASAPARSSAPASAASPGQTAENESERATTTRTAKAVQAGVADCRA
jgi:hypothetical protein